MPCACAVCSGEVLHECHVLCVAEGVLHECHVHVLCVAGGGCMSVMFCVWRGGCCMSAMCM